MKNITKLIVLLFAQKQYDVIFETQANRMSCKNKNFDFRPAKEHNTITASELA
jgi:hypothetical protein